ncbi:hypothetical protein M432DRAFT_653290 [Thermoascus aurantiacus ATCC 26904]
MFTSMSILCMPSGAGAGESVGTVTALLTTTTKPSPLSALRSPPSAPGAWMFRCPSFLLRGEAKQSTRPLLRPGSGPGPPPPRESASALSTMLIFLRSSLDKAPAMTTVQYSTAWTWTSGSLGSWLVTPRGVVKFDQIATKSMWNSLPPAQILRDGATYDGAEEVGGRTEEHELDRHVLYTPRGVPQI